MLSIHVYILCIHLYQQVPASYSVILTPGSGPIQTQSPQTRYCYCAARTRDWRSTELSNIMWIYTPLIKEIIVLFIESHFFALMCIYLRVVY